MPRRPSPTASAANLGYHSFAYTSFMSSTGHPSAPYTTTVDRMFQETMRRLDHHRRNEAVAASKGLGPKPGFVITPQVWRDAVTADKPGTGTGTGTGTPRRSTTTSTTSTRTGSARGKTGTVTVPVPVEDEEYIRYSDRMALPPRGKYDRPITASMSYGWQSKPLTNQNTPFQHRPRRSTEVTQVYGPKASVYDPRARAVGLRERIAR
ncbi:hypothetical protein HKX48_003186 [Thoreauomyces humboldtii]|nr:hypothetical protein HKX48_003186 [Thoreauomyces humboldtii]